MVGAAISLAVLFAPDVASLLAPSAAEAEQDAVWQQLGMFARLGLRKAPVGVRLATPDGKTRVVKAGDGVTVTGEPVELALWVSGRRAPARVAVTGSPEAVEAFWAWAKA